jgi:probable HAF family extracellular repeat protein
MNKRTRLSILLVLGILTFFCTASNSEAHKARYRYIDLGTLGGRYSWGNGINNWGQVAGVSETQNGEYRGFLWNGKKMKDLGVLDKDVFSGVWSINDRGQAVGFSVGSDNLLRAVFWDREGLHELDTLGGTENDALGIGTNGEIVGWATTHDEILHAVLWDSEGVIDLDPSQTMMSLASSINKKGEVVGGAFFSQDAQYHAALWNDQGTQDLGTLGGNESEAYAINDQGEIVGWCDLPGDVWHACMWNSRGDLADLGALDGSYSEAFSINGHGEVVGVYYLDADLEQVRPFLWTKRQGMVDLNTLTELPPGVTLIQALAINDFGWIAATNSSGTACLLIPDKGHKEMGHHKDSCPPPGRVKH